MMTAGLKDNLAWFHTLLFAAVVLFKGLKKKNYIFFWGGGGGGVLIS